MKRLVIVLLACTFLAGCGGNGRLTKIITMPYCHPSLDVCLINMGITATSHDSVTGHVEVKTQSEPKGFEVFARLYVRVRGVWYEQDTRTWKKRNLPPKGHTEILIPHLFTVPCFTSPWSMHLHLISISSTGVHQSTYFVYPAVSRATKFLLRRVKVSNHDIKQRDWGWVKITHCNA